MNPDYFAALESNFQKSLATPPQGSYIDEPLSARPKRKKNFWLDQISTAGGILGGIGGSLVSPIVGTGAGAAAGSSLGEALENLITGESIGKNVIKEGALGGIFGAGPVKLLKGGAALATGKGVQAASRAALTPLRQRAGQALVGGADDLAVKQFRLTPTQLANYNKKFKEDAGTTIRKYGFQNADDIAEKGIAPLQQQFDTAVTSIPGVTKESLKKSIMSRVNKLSASGPSDTKAIGSQLKKEADTILKNYGDVIDAKELNMIRRQFDDLVNYTEKVTNPARYGVNKRMADAIRETLQKADPSGSLKATGRELQKLRQLADNVSKQGQLGRGSLPLGLSTLMGGAAGGAAFGPAGIGTAAGVAAVNSSTGRRLAYTGAEKLGSALTKSGKSGQSALGIAGREIGQNLLLPRQQPESLEDALMNQSLENSASNPSTMPNSSAPMSADMMGRDYSNSGEMSSGSPYTRENLMADIQRDPKNANKYIEYYANLEEIFNPEQEQPKPLNQAQQERADLISALDLTEGAVNQGSINYGPIGSRVEGLKSVVNKADPETLNFKNTVSGLRAAITKARAGASLTPGELKLLAQYTPSDTDSEQVVRSKLAALRQLYGYQQPTGGGSSLEDALMQYQVAR